MPGKSKKGGGLEVSPYKMVGHTLPGPNQASPVKQKVWAFQQALKYGTKGVKYIKKAFSTSKTKPLGKIKTSHYEQQHPIPGHGPKITRHTYPGKHSATHPDFISSTSKRLKESQKYWFNPQSLTKK